MPSFHPHASQLGNVSTRDIPELPFSHVFDLPRLVAALASSRPGISPLQGILEWDVDIFPPGSHDYATSPLEPVGTWSAHRLSQRQGNTARFEKIGISPVFHAFPSFVLPTRNRVLFPELAAFVHPASPLFQPHVAALNLSAEPLPTAHVVVIDNLYYAVTHVGHFCVGEWAGYPGLREVGAWPAVGRFMHFTSALEDLGKEVAREIFDVLPGQDLPPFISVHIRHGARRSSSLL